MVINNDLIYSTLVGCIILALLLDLFYFKLKMRKRVAIVISMSFSLIATMYLYQNPALLNNLVFRISMVLIGLVVGLLYIIKRLA